MRPLKIFGKDVLDIDTEAHYAFYTSLKDTIGPHCHDFFEFFLVTSGKARHLVNSEEQILTEGALVFIRTEDIHYYLSVEGYNCSFINLAFPQRIITSLFNYLGDSFPSELYLESSLPPLVYLPKADKEILKQKLEDLNLISLSDKAAKRSELRTLLAELFTRYMLPKRLETYEPMPLWLSRLCSEMQKGENFTKGVASLMQLSGKTHEHICREMKRYLKQTPTTYINNLRLDYTANLITNTDMPIINISMEAGFNNLSHFNHLFKEKFGMNPSAFRNSALKKILY